MIKKIANSRVKHPRFPRDPDQVLLRPILAYKVDGEVRVIGHYKLSREGPSNIKWLEGIQLEEWCIIETDMSTALEFNALYKEGQGS